MPNSLTPTGQDLFFGDATTVPEEVAFGAYQTLRENKDAPDFATNPIYQQPRQALNSYLTERRAYGHKLFPNTTRIANQERNTSLANLYTKPLEETLSPETYSSFNRQLAFAPDPEAVKMREINRTYLSATLGRTIPADQYEYVRQVYAKQHLDLDKDTSEAAVFNSIKNRFTEEKASTATLQTLAKQTYADAIAGKPFTAPDLSAIPERLRPHVLDQIQETKREARRQIRQLQPTVATLTSQLKGAASALKESPGSEYFIPFEDIAANLPKDPAQKNLALALLSKELDSLPDLDKGAFRRFNDTIIRGTVDNLAIAAVRFPLEVGSGIRRSLPNGQEFQDISADNDTIRTDAQLLRKVLIGEIDPATKATDNLAVKSLILASGSAWTFGATLAGPVGWGGMASSFAGNSYQDARVQNPEGDRNAQLIAAGTSGIVQGSLEVALNKVGFKIIGGKLPGLAGILNKSKIFNPAARGTIAAGYGLGATTATEYTEEALQGATDRFAQDLALEFSNISPDTDWKGFFGEWLTVGGQEQRDTLLAILPFAAVGAGGGSFGHFKYGSALAKNRTVLDSLGVPKETIDQMVSTTDIQKTDKLFKQAFETGLEERTTEQKSAALEVMREINARTAAAGIDVITRADSAETYTFTDPISRETTEFETEEEALLHWRDIQLQQKDTALDTIAQAGREGAIPFLTSEGKASEDTRTLEEDRNITLPQAVKEGLATQEQLTARTEILILQSGLSPSQAAKELDSLTIRARSFTEQARDGQLRYTVQLFKNADPLDIFEDFSEDSIKRAIDDSLVDPSTLLREIRAYESASGDKLIDPAYTTEAGETLPLVEAFSALSRALVVGNARSELLPPTVSQWLEVMAAYGANTLQTAQATTERFTADLDRAGALTKQIQKGNLPPALLSRLQDSIGINEAEVLRRMEKKHEEQLIAEAMGEFPEIRDQASGILPHPETLRKEHHPLAGEVRRIWEAMKKPTRRRDAQGRQIDRTNEANAYFLPVGEMVDLDKIRENLNEKGFDFQTPADLLDALDSSISYNKPVYAVASRGNDSFSLGSDDTAQKLAQNVYDELETLIDTWQEADSAVTNYQDPDIDHESMDVIWDDNEGWVDDVTMEPLPDEYELGKAAKNAYYDVVIEAESVLKKYLEPMGYTVGKLPSGGSSYYEVYPNSDMWGKVIGQDEIDDFIDNNHIKIRFANHENQSRMHEASDANIHSTSDPLDELIYAFSELPSLSDYKKNPQSGTDGNRSLVSRSSEQVSEKGAGEISPTEQDPSTSFSLGSASFARLEQAIARKLTEAPDERAEFYSRVRDRLAATTQQLEDMDNGVGIFARKPTDDVGEERRRIQDAIAEARSIISALPIEARGRVDFDFADITSKTTEKGRVKALLRLMDKADTALEKVLQTAYLEAFSKTLDLASPDLRQNRSVRGRLTPGTQRKINAIIPITHLTQLEAQAEQIAAQAAYDSIESQYPDPTDKEAVTAWQTALADKQEKLDLIDTFSSLATQSSAELAEALKQLRTIYTKGRTARQITDQAKRSEIASQRHEVLESLGGMVSQPKWAKRTENQGILDQFESLRLGLSSFHEVMEWIFPNSIAARDYQKRLREAERGVTRARIDARDRFENFAFTAFNLTGRSRKRHLNKILAELSTRRDDWNLEIAEGTRFETEKMSEEQAAAILDGTLKPGWQDDLIAMESLRQALADFRLQRTTARDQAKAFSKKAIRFQRLTQRGAKSFLRMSDMEAVYFLQLAAQEQYLPTLDRYGYTDKVLKTLRANLDPRAQQIESHLRKEYDAQYGRLNPVHQALFGLDMPQIKNYAPGMFENMDAKQDPNISADGTGGAVNAMSSGFTKARTHHMARPRQTNALSNYWSSLENTEYFIAYAEVMRDMRQVFRAPEIRRTIEGNYGTRAATDFSSWLDTLETDGRTRSLEARALGEITQNLLTAQSAIGLAGNIGTVFKQFSAGIGHFMLMPTGAAIRSTYQALTDPASLRSVWNNEAVQQRIKAGITPEDKRLLDAANASPSFAMELLELGRAPIALADAAFTTLTGTAAYKYQYGQALKNGLSDAQAHETALRYLDHVITRTAQPATTQDKSLAENSAKGFTKALYLFKSDPRQKFALSASALRLALRGDINAPEAVRRIFFSWAIYGLMAQVANDAFRAISRDDDDEKLWQPADYAAAMVAGPLAGIPLFGAFLEAGIYAAFGSDYYTNSANPIDKAGANFLRWIDSGGKLGTLEAITADDIDANEILIAATRDAATISQILGAFSPSTAIIPASLRALRDTVGIGSNLYSALTPESDEDIAATIIREEKEAAKDKRDTRTTDIEATTQRLLSLSPNAREKALASLDSETRARVAPRLRRANMTPNEKALASMSLAARKAAVDRILTKLPENRRQPFLDRLDSLSINLPE